MQGSFGAPDAEALALRVEKGERQHDEVAQIGHVKEHLPDEAQIGALLTASAPLLVGLFLVKEPPVRQC